MGKKLRQQNKKQRLSCPCDPFAMGEDVIMDEPLSSVSSCFSEEEETDASAASPPLQCEAIKEEDEDVQMLTRQEILAAIAHRKKGKKASPLKAVVSKEGAAEESGKVAKASASKKECHVLDQLLDKSVNDRNKQEEYGPKKFIKP